uniref:Uncharacterized protein n=1 Tax=Arundo donax TaxID=35708 RepID=A0A0A9AYK7_ARUDO
MPEYYSRTNLLHYLTSMG